MKQSMNTLPQLGIFEWFHVNDRIHVEQTIFHLKKLGIRNLRTGVSWADYYTEEGREWYDWLIPHLASEFEILPCFMHTPSSYGILPEITSPPKDPKAFADFLDLFIRKHTEYFQYVELWNEPNNRTEYDYLLDNTWETFSTMIIMAANWCHQLGKKTVLGGISPIDPGFIRTMGQRNVLDQIDVIGIHGFPDVYDSHWRSWEESIDSIQEALDLYDSKAEIWITKTGYSTWRYDERIQVEKFIKVLSTPVSRVYWYSLYDIPGNVPTAGGEHHTDDREYHFGILHDDNSPKLLFRLWISGGIKNILTNEWMTGGRMKNSQNAEEPVLITGGAGFIGTNLADRLLSLGSTVYIYDNLSRPGVENNLKWLKKKYRKNLNIIIDDVRNAYALEEAVKKVSHVFHFAAQVAVTTSLIKPAYDYSVNVRGTLNLLEAIRKSSNKPSLIFTSTNKVYGNLDDIPIVRNSTRYYPDDTHIYNNGIDELRRLDFHSPYGSSKGAADQYVLDYARSFDLNNVVFRMSCIYGTHQFGTEDQGWIAYFILKALRNEEIIIYGDGMQVRDILFVEDLVEAFLLAWKNIGKFRGEAYNMGGGRSNSISLTELLALLENLIGRPVSIRFDEWRKGDQKYYISDTSKFTNATGWKPQVSVHQGISLLYDWLNSFYKLNATRLPVTREFAE